MQMTSWGSCVFCSWGNRATYTHVPENCKGRTLYHWQPPGGLTLRHQSFRFALLFRWLIIVLSGGVILVLLWWGEYSARTRLLILFYQVYLIHEFHLISNNSRQLIALILAGNMDLSFCVFVWSSSQLVFLGQEEIPTGLVATWPEFHEALNCAWSWAQPAGPAPHSSPLHPHPSVLLSVFLEHPRGGGEHKGQYRVS